MSGLLNDITALAGQQFYRPASFRGVPFYVDSHDFSFGRRVAKFEFAKRDVPDSEDMGRKQDGFRLRAYVIGPGYQANRDALIVACRDMSTPGTLVHPWLGTRRVRAELCTQREDGAAGGMASFDLAFVEAGLVGGPTATPSTASQLLAALNSAISMVQDAYTTVLQVIANPFLLVGMAGDLLGLAGLSAMASLVGVVAQNIAGLVGGIVGSLSLLDAPTQAALTTQFAAFSAAPADAASTAATVTGAFSAAAQAIAVALAAQLVAQQAPEDPILGVTPLDPPSADPSYGLAALATWGSGLAPVTGGTPTQIAMAANQAAIVALVQGAAVVGVAALYAQTEWTSAQAAEDAASQLGGMIMCQAAAAADADQDALYMAWLALATLAQADMRGRAQSLPSLSSYNIGASLPALALAQRLYADPTRADELAALNDVIDPSFMPPIGRMLVP